MYKYNVYVHTHIYNPKCNFLSIYNITCMYVYVIVKFQTVSTENMHTSTYMPTYSWAILPVP